MRTLHVRSMLCFVAFPACPLTYSVAHAQGAGVPVVFKHFCSTFHAFMMFPGAHCWAPFFFANVSRAPGYGLPTDDGVLCIPGLSHTKEALQLSQQALRKAVGMDA